MSFEIVARPHQDNFLQWAADKPEVVVLSADLTNSCEVGVFRDAYPDRFYSMGMAEQNMLSVAAGMAREGLEPWLHTFSVFLYRRPLDQLQMSVAYPALPVRLVGFLPGITTPGGVTHQAIEDIAVLRAVPNMTILEVGDATEVESVIDVAHTIDGPVYIRQLRGEVSRIFPKEEPMVLNSARKLSSGTDVALMTSGIMTEEALRALPLITQRGVSVDHLHISTLKPFTDPAVLESMSRVSKGVITMENHSIVGGLGSAVAEVMAENGVGAKLSRIGIPDTYAHGASQKYLMAELGLDARALVTRVEQAVGESLNITDEELTEARIVDVHSSAKAEAL
ncbi:MAG: transketolase [Microbacteriaceae bacterium]|jgi:transketolase|nr:transketolase [Microbacteriaceae bacterium]MBT7803695.1 transketolase [Microbacteriaceae bacterium]